MPELLPFPPQMVTFKDLPSKKKLELYEKVVESLKSKGKHDSSHFQKAGVIKVAKFFFSDFCEGNFAGGTSKKFMNEFRTYLREQRAEGNEDVLELTKLSGFKDGVATWNETLKPKRSSDDDEDDDEVQTSQRSSSSFKKEVKEEFIHQGGNTQAYNEMMDETLDEETEAKDELDALRQAQKAEMDAIRMKYEDSMAEAKQKFEDAKLKEQALLEAKHKADKERVAKERDDRMKEREERKVGAKDKSRSSSSGAGAAPDDDNNFVDWAQHNLTKAQLKFLVKRGIVNPDYTTSETGIVDEDVEDMFSPAQLTDLVEWNFFTYKRGDEDEEEEQPKAKDKDKVKPVKPAPSPAAAPPPALVNKSSKPAVGLGEDSDSDDGFVRRKLVSNRKRSSRRR